MALIHVNFFSDVLGMSSQMEVVLPQQTDRQIGVAHTAQRAKIPVLYLLHGMTDNHTTWSRNTSIERYASERGIAVIMPNGHLSWYTNMHMGFDYFTYISEEIPRVAARFFPALSTAREDTFIAGNSMGGYGAMLHGLKCPERFAGIASLSGGMDAYQIARNHENSFNPTLWSDIFGDVEAIPGSEHDLFTLASQLSERPCPHPAIYMWCGRSDFLYDQNIRMKEHLETLNWDMTYRESPGDHSWKYWDRQIIDILDWMAGIQGGER